MAEAYPPEHAWQAQKTAVIACPQAARRCATGDAVLGWRPLPCVGKLSANCRAADGRGRFNAPPSDRTLAFIQELPWFFVKRTLWGSSRFGGK
jgi:hypothetical protein